jgi:zinc D-Ala-D-Ala carboxypeptidase
MNLSTHFTLSELTNSDWAERNNVDNTPPQDVIVNLKLIAEKLEEVRTLLDHPIIISSGYRNSKVNKAIGGKPTSKHIQGLAADIKSPYGTPEQVCRAIAESGITFGKCILEFYNPVTGGGWVHIQIGTERKILTINQHGTFSGIHV